MAVQRQLPGVRLHVVEALGHTLRNAVNRGEVDLGLVFLGGQLQAGDWERVLTDRLFFVTAKASLSHQPMHQGPVNPPSEISLEEALMQPLALPAPEDSLRECVDGAARNQGLTPSFVYQVQSVGMTLSLVEAGLASTFVPISVVHANAQRENLAVMRIHSPALLRDLVWIESTQEARMVLRRKVKQVVQSAMAELASDPVFKGAYLF